MREFDLYDFDKTVYPQDSETVFLFYCLFRRPCLLILAPYLLFNLILFFLGFGDKYKGKCFTFLRFIDGEKMAAEFWKNQRKRIYPIFNPETSTPSIVVVAWAATLSFLHDLEPKNSMYNTTNPTSNTAFSAIKHLCAQVLHDLPSFCISSDVIIIFGLF